MRQEVQQGDFQGRRILLQLSGGKDSCAALAFFRNAGAILEAVHFVHRHAYRIPSEMARSICRRLGVPLHEVDITDRLLSVLLEHPTDRPCRHCKSVMDQMTVGLAANLGCRFIAVGDTGEDTALVNRLERGCESSISRYFNKAVVLPPGMRVLRPFLKWTSDDVYAYLLKNDIRIERVGDTGDKYLEYSREGCPLQFRDAGMPFTSGLMESLARANRLVAEFASANGIRASVHLPSGRVVTIPAGFEESCRRHLLVSGVQLPDNPMHVFDGYRYALNVPALPAWCDSRILEDLTNRIAERLSLEHNSVEGRISSSGKSLDVMIDSGTSLTELRLRALALEVFQTREVSISRLVRAPVVALVIMPQERRSRFKFMLAARLLTRFGMKVVDWLNCHGYMSLHLVGDGDIARAIAEMLPYMRVSSSAEKPTDTCAYEPVDLVAVLEEILWERLADYCGRRRIRLIVCNESDVHGSFRFTAEEQLDVDIGKSSFRQHQVPLVDEGLYLTAEDARLPGLTIEDGERLTLPIVNDSSSSFCVRLVGNCVPFGLFADDEDTLASQLQALFGTKGPRVKNLGAPTGRFPLNTLFRALMEPMESGDVLVLMDYFRADLLKDHGDVYNLDQWFKDGNGRSERWFADSKLHLINQGFGFVARRLFDILGKESPPRVDLLRCNAFSYEGEFVDFSSHALALSPYIRHVAGYAACADTRTLPMYFPPAPEGFHAPVRRLAYVRSILHRYAPGVLSRLPDAPDPSPVREILVKFHCEVSQSTVEDVYRRLSSLGSVINDERAGAAVVHYGLNGKHGKHSTFHFFIDSPQDVDSALAAEISNYFSLKSKKVLLYLGKFPSGSSDVDGGSQMARQLVDTLKDVVTTDVTFIRKTRREFHDPSVRHTAYVRYVDPDGNKFWRRMENLESNRIAIKNGHEYDLIVAAHCSKIFGLAEDADVMSRTVLFPMFLSSGYRRAGENVPAVYTEEERKVLARVSRIITPSDDEREDILRDYGVSHDRILVIPRGLDTRITRIRRSPELLNLISIGSIKRQKNHSDELDVLARLRKSGFAARLTIVGDVYDQDEMAMLLEKARELTVSEYVEWLGGLSREQLVAVLKRMTVGISTSKWETFGRGIFECLASGLPMVMSDSLETVRKRLAGNEGAVFCRDNREMADFIVELVTDHDRYERLSKAAASVGDVFTSAIEQERLLYALVAQRFGYSTRFTCWNSDEGEVLYAGAYSECRRVGGRVRKYFRYDNREAVEYEFDIAREMWSAGVPTPRPLFCAWDSIRGRWFMESEFVHSVPIAKWTEQTIADALRILRKIRSVRVPERWNALVEDMAKNLEYYGQSYGTEESESLAYLRSLKLDSALHGDFTPRNIASTDDGGLVVYDFQCATVGPSGWDEDYLMANFLPGDLPETCLEQANPHRISLILKVRIARAARRGENAGTLVENLRMWEELVR